MTKEAVQLADDDHVYVEEQGSALEPMQVFCNSHQLGPATLATAKRELNVGDVVMVRLVCLAFFDRFLLGFGPLDLATRGQALVA